MKIQSAYLVFISLLLFVFNNCSINDLNSNLSKKNSSSVGETSCFGEQADLEQIVNNWCSLAKLNNGDHIYYVDPSHPLASDDNDGTYDGSGPWLTIQSSVLKLKAGDTLYVREGVYSEWQPIPGSTLDRGVVFESSGTEQAPIHVAAYPGERVIIDTNYKSPGFFIAGQSDIIIEGFEIRNTSTGVSISSGHGLNARIKVINNYIHHLDGPPGTNISGVRVDIVDSPVIKNNIIHTVRVGGEDNGNAAGILSYEMFNSTIEENTIFDAHSGIFHKIPYTSAQENAGVFRRNYIFNVKNGIYLNTNELVDPGIHLNTEISFNVIQAEGTIYDHTYQTVYQNKGLKFFNNTVFSSGFSIRGMAEVEQFNNVYICNRLTSSACEIRTTFQTHVYSEPEVRKLPGLKYSDYNIYWPGLNARIGVYSGDEHTVSGIDDWRSVNINLDSLDFTTPPDINSQVIDPLLNDKGIPNENSPLKRIVGRNGSQIGAYTTQTPNIGFSP